MSTIKWGGNVLTLSFRKFGNITKQTLPEILNSDEAINLEKLMQVELYLMLV